jgi:hypothetical protein
MAKKTPKSTPPLPALDLSDLDTSRNAMVAILQRFYAGQIQDKKFRTLCFGFQTLIGYLRLQAETEWQQRLARIEAMLIEKGCKIG